MDKMAAAVSLQPVDFYPFLRPWYRIVPVWLSSYKRRLREIQILEDRLFFSLLDGAKEKIESGKVYPSRILKSLFKGRLFMKAGFIRDMLVDKDADRLSDRQIAHNAGHGFGAAT